MAIEITPTVGCATCAAPLCPACLGCTSCRTVYAGCICPAFEFTAERVDARRAWLAAGRALGAHIDGCRTCRLPSLPDCDDGRALRAAADAAWDAYAGVPR